jgi:hypothetical protein
MTEAARRHDWTSLEHALDEVGVGDEEFEALAVVALREVVRRRSGGEPASLFTEEEARILQEGRLDLAGRRRGESDMAARTATKYAAMLLEAKSAAQVARDLGVTPARVRQRAIERTLYGIRDGDEWRFPRWQFDATGRPIRGLAAVFPSISRELHPIAAYRFLSEPSPDLEVDAEPVSPLMWLATGGDPEPIAAIAATL